MKKDNPTSSDVHVDGPLPGKKKNKLRSLTVKEVSLVDRPANQLSKVTLYKRDNNQNGDTILSEKAKSADREGEFKMTPEELAKALEAEKKATELAKAENDALKKENEELKAKKAAPPKKKPGNAEEDATDGGKDDNEETPTMKMAAVETFVTKAVSEALAPVMKANEELTKRLTSEVEKREVLELEKRVEKEYPNIPGTANEKAQMLKAIESMPEAQRDPLLKNLKAQNDILGTSFREYGGQGSIVKGDAESQLDTLAKSYQEKHTGMTFEKAYSEVINTTEGQKLYKQHTSEKPALRVVS